MKLAAELVEKFAKAHAVNIVVIVGQLEINVDAVLVVVCQIYVIVILNIRLAVVDGVVVWLDVENYVNIKWINVTV